ncbi:F-box/kelch-repeat protein At3g23880-like [Vicia villosa]|uniref:F-box/kelch-repeat protein At3g23880-like n=1 Tax=Vicia villosa TaxID=3911 RepID=UPI00273B88E4|nr:F-box/kelch-repeat protein At3g23880-like [Vicia villosa]
MNLIPTCHRRSPVYLPEELVAEVLSILPVKSLLQLRCVSKSWKSLISNPIFVKQHLNRSTRNANLTLVSSFLNEGVAAFCISFFNEHTEMRLRVWNPATRAISEKLGFSSYDNVSHPPTLTFGYDDSTDTYKVTYFIPNRRGVRVLSLGHNVWRNIQNSPQDHGFKLRFDEGPIINPNLRVLRDCLCFSHDFNQTHFVIWQMKEFGVEDSWTQLLKISYHSNLQIDYPFDEFHHSLVPLCLLEKNDTLLLTYTYQRHITLYNWRDNRVKRINQSWPFHPKNYVECLVWYC